MLGRQVKNMKEVDARGLSCPEPLMLTAEALKECKRTDQGSCERTSPEDEH